MSGFAVFITYALAAVFAQNVLFSGAAGVSDVLSVCSKPKGRLVTSALVSLFSFCGTLVAVLFSLALPYEMSYMPLLGLVSSLGILLFYFIFARIVVRLGDIKEKLGPYLAPSAINGAVLILPLAASYSDNTSAAAMLGLSLGSGVGYLASSLLVSRAVRLSKDPLIPKPMQGIPVILIYIAVVSLALCSIGGDISFIN